MSVEEVLARVDELSVTRADGQPGDSGISQKLSLVELTGGEPLVQPEVIPFTQKLLDKGYLVMMETSGERPVAEVPPDVIKIVNVKCPDSGEPDSFLMENLDALDAKDEFKFVNSSGRDFEFARGFTREHDLGLRVREVIFSPVHADPAGARPGLNP
jgi:7-carboxy-7-deazaguanine synthase